MDYTVKFITKAQTELLDATKWYDMHLPGLGNRFEFSVKLKINSILKNPLLYPNKKSNFRECKIDDFPFLIVYEVQFKKNEIVISSIFIQVDDPEKNIDSNQIPGKCFFTLRFCRRYTI